MKGVILAGGTGSRLWPLTSVLSKQLLAVYDKPMIFYPITTLMFAGVREIAIVTTQAQQESFKATLGSGEKWGLKFDYCVQSEPKGIPDALKSLPRYFKNEPIVMILGDNLLYGMGLGSSLAGVFNGTGALAFGYPVVNPNEYGVVELDQTGNVKSITEKPISPKSNLAIPGFYFFDETVHSKVLELTPSLRGELEVTDILKLYQSQGNLRISVLQRGTAWLDTGTAESLIQAGEFVKVIEDRQGLKIGCPEEVAFREGLINGQEFLNCINNSPNSTYRDYLISVAAEFGLSVM